MFYVRIISDMPTAAVEEQHQANPIITVGVFLKIYIYMSVDTIATCQLLL